MEECREYFGKYRGRIENNLDPQGLGRVQVSVPAVLGEGRLSWAMPCTPYAGPGVGLLMIPPLDAQVWVEFEAGNPDYPIWSGCFWGLGETPNLPPGPTQVAQKILQTEAVKLLLDDLPGVGGVTIEVGPPVAPVAASITIGPQGITIAFGPNEIKLGPIDVSVNKGNLSVLP